MRIQSLVPQLTLLIERWKNNDEVALNQLIALSYNRLHISARQALGYYHNHASIQTTELVNELYLHFRNQKNIQLNDVQHFFSISTLKLRQILNTRYSKNSAKKRNFGLKEDASIIDKVASTPSFVETWVLHDYLSFLESIDITNARIAELKLFWEFNNFEVAEIMGVSESTVRRKWNATKSIIARKLAGNVVSE